MSGIKEIKFRGYDEENQCWRYGSYCNFNGVCSILVDGDFYRMAFAVTPESVGQFTGWKDAHGVDIYEGDVVKFTAIDAAHEEFQSEGQVEFDDFEYVVHTKDSRWSCISFKCIESIEVVKTPVKRFSWLSE